MKIQSRTVLDLKDLVKNQKPFEQQNDSLEIEQGLNVSL